MAVRTDIKDKKDAALGGQPHSFCDRNGFGISSYCITKKMVETKNLY